MRKAFAPRRYRLPLQLFLISGAMLLAGCSIQNERVASTNFYDLGPAPVAGTTPTAQSAIAITVAEVSPAVWLDTQLIFYRLLYANAQQTSAYAQQRWLMQPTA